MKKRKISGSIRIRWADVGKVPPLGSVLRDDVDAMGKAWRAALLRTLKAMGRTKRRRRKKANGGK